MTTYYEVEPMTGLEGPFHLSANNVTRIGDAPGVYILSNPSTKGEFLACYVGRSASLRRRLASHVGKYRHFYVKYQGTEEGSYFTECRLFHRYGKANYLDNTNHPAKPPGSTLPVCSEQGCRGEAY